MSKTREELRLAGVELNGPIVPEHFKWKVFSDACSIKGSWFRKVLNADQTKAACFIHDYEYFLTNICYTPGSKKYRASRHEADVHLRWNRTLIGKGFIRGQVFGRIYYRGVRFPIFGGARAMRRKHGKLVAPPSMQSLNWVRKDCLSLCNGRLTAPAVRQLQQWHDKITEESTDEPI